MHSVSVSVFWYHLSVFSVCSSVSFFGAPGLSWNDSEKWARKAKVNAMLHIIFSFFFLSDAFNLDVTVLADSFAKLIEVHLLPALV